MSTYYIGTDPNGQAYILCRRCDYKSYNINDIAHKYCGYCHKYHEDK